MDRLIKIKARHPEKIREFYQVKQITKARSFKGSLKRIIDKIRGKLPENPILQSPFHSLYTYVKLTKKICFIIVIIAGVFWIITAIKRYRVRQFQKQQDEIKKQMEVEENRKDSAFVDILLSKIFDKKHMFKNNHDAPILVSKKFRQNFEIDESTTHPCSCEYGEDECAGCLNGNISEISYWNDVIQDELNLVVHNANNCSEYTKKAETDQIRKQLHYFNKSFKDARRKVLEDSCRGKIYVILKTLQFHINSFPLLVNL